MGGLSGCDVRSQTLLPVRARSRGVYGCSLSFSNQLDVVYGPEWIIRNEPGENSFTYWIGTSRSRMLEWHEILLHNCIRRQVRLLEKPLTVYHQLRACMG